MIARMLDARECVQPCDAIPMIDIPDMRLRIRFAAKVDLVEIITCLHSQSRLFEDGDTIAHSRTPPKHGRVVITVAIFPFAIPLLNRTSSTQIEEEVERSLASRTRSVMLTLEVLRALELILELISDNLIYKYNISIYRNNLVNAIKVHRLSRYNAK